LVPLCCMEALIRMGFFGRILRFSYIPYVFYPYGQETYLNLPNAYIFFPLGFILIAYAVYGRLLQGSEGSPLRVWPGFQLLLFLYGLVAVFTGPFAALYGLPLLVFVLLKRRRLSLAPVWLTVPVLLSSVQLYLSQLTYSYKVSTAEAISQLLARPDALLDWFTIHLVSPLFGGYKPGWYLRVLPEPLQLLLVAVMVAVVVLAVRVVSRRMRQPALLYLAMFSTMVLSLSSLLVAVRRGVPIVALTVEDAGGRFFFWNTVLFLTILLTAFVLLVRDRTTRQGTASRILACWLILSIVFYHNNVARRAAPISYTEQLEQQCRVPGKRPMELQIFAGPVWSFHLDRPQIDRLCAGTMRFTPMNTKASDVLPRHLQPLPLKTGQTLRFPVVPREDLRMEAVGLLIGTNNRLNHGVLRLCVQLPSAAAPVCSVDVDKRRLQDNRIARFPFADGLALRSGEKVEVSLSDLDRPGNRTKGDTAVYVSKLIGSPVAFAGSR